MSFENLGLTAELVRAVAAQGYTQATPIQQQAIPVILAGRDVMAAAQTGTGKTAGFTLPLLQRLQAKIAQDPERRPLRALILTPTRELAAQVDESVRTYGRYLAIRSTAVFGGVGVVPQQRILRRGVDVLVATPGRLLDHLSQRNLDLRYVETLVLDEADRMLDMGFIHDIRKVLAQLPKQRQNLLFSATFSAEIKALAAGILRDPALIEVARQNSAAESVQQVVHPVDHDRKRQLLSYLIGSNNWRQVLVFTRTKHGADRLAKQLAQDGITTAAIHGNKTQGARTKALADFKRGMVRTLVATDIAARGLDIDQLPHVVNYELPNVPEDYVHRIGRTGRAGCEGQAMSLVCADESKLLRDIERLLQRDISKIIVNGYEPSKALQTAPANKPGPSKSNRPAARQGEPNKTRRRRDDGHAKQGAGARNAAAQARPRKTFAADAVNTNAKPQRQRNDDRRSETSAASATPRARKHFGSDTGAGTKPRRQQNQKNSPWQARG